MTTEYQSTINDLQNSLMRSQEQTTLWMKNAEQFSREAFMNKISLGRYKKILEQMHEIALKNNNQEIITYYEQVTRNQ